MADHNPKAKFSIPPWQMAQTADNESKSSESAPSLSSAETDNANVSTSTPKMTLLEQAQKFLEDEKIETAPRERKVAFLEKKGLQSDDIQKLLGPDDEADSSSSERQTELKTVHDSNDTATSTQIEPQSSVQTVPSQQSPSVSTSAPASASPSITPPTTQRDAAPIITYPEFLLKPQKPPPLVTVQRIINAAYALAGISAITYGTSKYLVQPMLESLTEARHELAEQAKSDLSKLNNKLESSVSHVPYIPSSAVLNSQKTHDPDTESIDSDPTELFHRDIATQTSEPTSSSNLVVQSDAKDPSTHQSSRLNSLQATLSGLLQSVETSTPAESRLRQTSSDFQAVLDKIESNQYQNAFASSVSGNGGKTWTPDSNSNTATNTNSSSTPYLYGGTGAIRRPGASDTLSASGNEVAKFKAEIRALKGVFLSSRNFPTAKPLTASSAANTGSR